MRARANYQAATSSVQRIITLTLLAIFFLDQKIALWARAHPIPDLAGRPLAEDPTSTKYRGGDIGRELMFLEQFGQFTRDGAIGSHLENLQRHGGFKGFNQKSVSVVIAATDPRKNHFAA